MTDEVAELVLEDNDAQNAGAGHRPRPRPAPMVDVHARYLRSPRGTRASSTATSSSCPTDKQLRERARPPGLGLTTPEFAVLLAYTKTTNVAEVLASDLPDDPYLQPELVALLPAARCRSASPTVMRRHRLRREIIATVRGERDGQQGRHVVRLPHDRGDRRRACPTSPEPTWWPRDVFGMAPLWDEIGKLDGQSPSDVQFELFLDLRRMVERGVLWLLRHRRPPLEIGATVAAFGPASASSTDDLPEAVVGRQGRGGRWPGAPTLRRGRRARRPGRAGPRRGRCCTPASTSSRWRRPAAGRPWRPPRSYWELFDELDLNWLWDRIGLLPRADRWQSHARAAPARRPDGRPARADRRRAARRRPVHGVERAGGASGWRPTSGAVERVREVFGEIRSGGTFDLTTLSVALRQLRNLVLTSSPCR